MILKAPDDFYFMKQAINEALVSLSKEEVPIGAIIVCEGKIIARGHNMTQQLNDTTAHAEMIAITSASNYLNSKYLSQCTLYVTLEPCLMCAGACSWAQVGRIVYGAKDSKKGYRTFCHDVFHPKTTVTSGINEEECSKLLTDFFLKRRK